MLAAVITLVALALPTADFYGRVGELKEPDWNEPVAASDPGLYSKVEELKVPEWAQPSASELHPENEALYAKLDDLKDPY